MSEGANFHARAQFLKAEVFDELFDHRLERDPVEWIVGLFAAHVLLIFLAASTDM